MNTFKIVSFVAQYDERGDDLPALVTDYKLDLYEAEAESLADDLNDRLSIRGLQDEQWYSVKPM